MVSIAFSLFSCSDGIWKIWHQQFCCPSIQTLITSCWDLELFLWGKHCVVLREIDLFGVFHAPLNKESRWEANSHKTGYSGQKWVCCAHDWTHRAKLSQCQVNPKSCVKKWEILEESNSHITWIDISPCLPSVYSGSILYQLQFLIHIKKAGYVYLQQECPESCLVLIVSNGSYLT